MGSCGQKRATVIEPIVIEPWMCQLGFKPSELVAFALIFGYEKNNGYFDGGFDLISAACGIQKRQTTSLIASLLSKGYLVEDVEKSKNGRRRVLRTEIPKVTVADIAGAETATVADIAGAETATVADIAGAETATVADIAPFVLPKPQVIPIVAPNIDSNRDLSWTDGRNSNQPTNRPTGGTGSQEDEIFSRLLTATVSPNRKRFARKPFDALLAQGFSGEEIIDAWQSVQEDARRRGGMNEGGKFMPQLTKWLENDAFFLLQERRFARTSEAGPRLLRTNSSWIACYQGDQAVVKDEAGRIMPADSDRRDVMRAAVKMFEKGDR